VEFWSIFAFEGPERHLVVGNFYIDIFTDVVDHGSYFDINFGRSRRDRLDDQIKI